MSCCNSTLVDPNRDPKKLCWPPSCDPDPLTDTEVERLDFPGADAAAAVARDNKHSLIEDCMTILRLSAPNIHCLTLSHFQSLDQVIVVYLLGLRIISFCSGLANN